ncbi:hypothetical protein KEM55_005170 [Ascosphaera atra]|nr:hypothetical protein KEM55_005170 [Ascosphaera atra]
MGPKLAPTNPDQVMVIRDICENIVTLSVPFSRFGFVRVGGRGTIGTTKRLPSHFISANPATVKLQSGSLAVFSPVALTPSVQDKLTKLGNKVHYLIAPDIEHHIFLSPWAQAYPQARIIAPHGLPEKREKNPETKGLDFTYVFTPENKLNLSIDEEFDSEFSVEYVDAHINRELVFLHRPTRTMITADLLFNLPAFEQYSRSPEDPTQGCMTRMFNLMGTTTQGSRIWQKRFLWYLVIKNRKGCEESVARMKKWEFDRIVMSHGEVIESGAKRAFLDVFGWYLPKEERGRV